MKKTIKLYNHFHNGDIFFSRILIKLLIKNFNIEFYHNMKSPLLPDIENLKESTGIPKNFPLQNSILEQDVVNTWIGQKNMFFLRKVNVNQGCSFENYMTLCKEITDHYGIKINNHEDILPEINYDVLPNIEKLKKTINELKINFKKIILISNGNVNSGQSSNFDFSKIILKLSQDNPNKLFLTTKDTDITNQPNIIHTSKLTNVEPDLLYISYISTKSDIIIGRASGPYCFSQVKENILNPNKTFIAFSHSYDEAKYFGLQKSKFIWSNNFSEDNIINTIKKNL